MKKNILVISILIIFNILIYKANAQTLVGTIDNYPYFQTAVKLYSNGYYPEARMLLLTMLYTNGISQPFNIYSRFLVAMSYVKESKIPRAIRNLEILKNDIEAEMGTDEKEKFNKYHKIFCEVNYQIAKLYFFEKEIDSFIVAKEYFDSECFFLNKTMKDELNLLEIASLIYEMRWKDALDNLNYQNFSNRQLKNYISSRLTEIQNHRDKSPLLGGILSIIPGLGHIYAGRFNNGLRSFLFNTAFSGLTAYTAIKKEYIFTSIFGLIELVLYTSNIYGGIDAVNQANALYYIKNRDDILKKIPVSRIHIISVRKEIGL